MTESKYIFIRDNKTGEPTLKYAALAQFKSDSIRRSMFFDDLAAMRRELEFIADNLKAQSEAFTKSEMELSVPAIIAFPHMDPNWFSGAIDLLEEEMDLIVQVWRNRVRKAKTWSLSKTISAMYTVDQEQWIPELQPQDMSLPEHYLPFMKDKDRLFHMHLIKDKADFAAQREKYAADPNAESDDVDDIVLDEV